MPQVPAERVKGDESSAANATSVFSGPDALERLFDPDFNPPAPLVELPSSLNPLTECGVRIFAKLLYLLPLLNLKSLPALEMLRQASLDGVHTLVENSSGNTAFSLAILARLFGIHAVRAVVPIDIAPGKLELLRLAGVDVRFSPSEDKGIEVARRVGERPGFLNLDQYANPANIDAHAKWTTAQVWEQTEGKLTVYAAGLGTTGTTLGAIQYFRERAADVTVVGVYVLPDSAVPGVRSIERLKEVSFDWEAEVPSRVGVATKESYKKSLELCREGVLAGPSSGLALAGLIRFLTEHQDLDALRNADGEVVAAFICSDTPFLYLDKYSTILDPIDFAVRATHKSGVESEDYDD